VLFDKGVRTFRDTLGGKAAREIIFDLEAFLQRQASCLYPLMAELIGLCI
jgi:hypothetical protein